MKAIVLKIEPDHDLVLPFSHFHTLQGLVYDLLSYDPNLSKEVHARRNASTDAMKLFCFSELRGRHRIEGGRIIYFGPFFLEVRSPEDRYIDTIEKSVTEYPQITVDGCKCRVVGARSESISFTGNRVMFRMNTPITVYRTDVDRKRRYYSPREEEFYEIIRSNLLKKYSFVYGKEYEGSFSFFCPAPERCRKIVARYKGTFMIAFFGTYLLEASPKMLDIAYFCGIGGKNSMGFGVADIVGD